MKVKKSTLSFFQTRPTWLYTDQGSVVGHCTFAVFVASTRFYQSEMIWGQPWPFDFSLLSRMVCWTNTGHFLSYDFYTNIRFWWEIRTFWESMLQNYENQSETHLLQRHRWFIAEEWVICLARSRSHSIRFPRWRAWGKERPKDQTVPAEEGKRKTEHHRKRVGYTAIRLHQAKSQLAMVAVPESLQRIAKVSLR